MNRTEQIKKRFKSLYRFEPIIEENKLIFKEEYVVFYPELNENFNHLLETDSCVVFQFNEKHVNEFTLSFFLNKQEVELSINSHEDNVYELTIELLEPNDFRFQYKNLNKLRINRETAEKLQKIAEVFIDCFQNTSQYRLPILTGVYKIKEDAIKSAFEKTVQIIR